MWFNENSTQFFGWKWNMENFWDLSIYDSPFQLRNFRHLVIHRFWRRKMGVWYLILKIFSGTSKYRAWKFPSSYRNISKFFQYTVFHIRFILMPKDNTIKLGVFHLKKKRFLGLFLTLYSIQFSEQGVSKTIKYNRKSTEV